MKVLECCCQETNCISAVFKIQRVPANQYNAKYDLQDDCPVKFGGMSCRPIDLHSTWRFISERLHDNATLSFKFVCDVKAGCTNAQQIKDTTRFVL